MPDLRLALLPVLAAAWGLAPVGCHVFSPSTDKVLDAVGLRVRPLGMARDAMQLEFVFAQRPGHDPLMGEDLWNRLDTIGRRPAAMRASLARHGIRVGQIGSTPPPALEELLGLTAPELGGADVSGPARRKDLRGWRIYLRDGGQTEVILHDEPVAEAKIQIAEAKTPREFFDVRFILRITARRLREGWVRLECLPEVHHGPRRLRHTATEAGWGFRTRQEIVPLFELKFTVDLTVGEMTVVTAAETSSGDSLGQQFFTTATGLKKLLVVRLANMPRDRRLHTRLARSRD
ncbi:MAG: hypothetical protein CMJ65_18030 [Planctomycetaceae bacterium]|jgi:hypothetical protein|nr:hypothetical protein [Planctomycetaceae bacterium]MDP7277510.1 hypothetical protein [Planctomycetaceae bacterium]